MVTFTTFYYFNCELLPVVGAHFTILCEFNLNRGNSHHTLFLTTFSGSEAIKNVMLNIVCVCSKLYLKNSYNDFD